MAADPVVNALSVGALVHGLVRRQAGIPDDSPYGESRSHIALKSEVSMTGVK